MSIFSSTNRYMNSFSEINNEEHFIRKYPTYIRELDDYLVKGFDAGLDIIAGGSNAGKTSFAIQLAATMAKHGQPVFYFALEQPKEALFAKVLVVELEQQHGLHIKADDILFKEKASEMPIENQHAYTAAVDPIINQFASSFYIYDTKTFEEQTGKAKMTVEAIGEVVEAYVKETERVPVIFVDYLQIIPPVNDNVEFNETAATNEISTHLVKLARRYNTAVIAISSMKKESSKGDIEMDSIRGSGQIVYGADLVLGLQFEKSPTFDLTEAKSKSIRDMEIIVLKQRFGTGAGKLPCKFHAEYSYFDFSNEADSDVFDISTLDINELEEVNMLDSI